MLRSTSIIATVPACTPASHADITRSPADFVAGTETLYAWPADATPPGYRLLGGRCSRCRSDLAIQVVDGHPLVVGLEKD